MNGYWPNCVRDTKDEEDRGEILCDVRLLLAIVGFKKGLVVNHFGVEQLD